MSLTDGHSVPHAAACGGRARPRVPRGVAARTIAAAASMESLSRQSAKRSLEHSAAKTEVKSKAAGMASYAARLGSYLRPWMPSSPCGSVVLPGHVFEGRRRGSSRLDGDAEPRCAKREHYILIVLYPEVSQAVFLDSSRINDPKKEYVELKNVLDDALCDFSMKGGCLKKTVHISGKKAFSYKTKFTCLKQPPKCMSDAYYIILHMKDIVRHHQNLVTLTQLEEWGKDNADRTVEALKAEFYSIQQSLGTIIYNDVLRRKGMFHGGNPKRQDIADRLEQQGDTREFNTIGGILPFKAKLVK